MRLMLPENKYAGRILSSHDALPVLLQTRAARDNKRAHVHFEAFFLGLAYEWNIITDSIDWYGKISETLGYSRTAFPATLQEWHNLLHPDEHTYVGKRLYYHLKAQEPYLIEYRVRKRNGKYVYALDTGTTLRNDCGTPYKFTGVIHLSHRSFYIMQAKKQEP